MKIYSNANNYFLIINGYSCMLSFFFIDLFVVMACLHYPTPGQTETDTDTDKLTQDPMWICVGVCLCSMNNSLQPILICLSIGFGHCQYTISGVPCSSLTLMGMPFLFLRCFMLRSSSSSLRSSKLVSSCSRGSCVIILSFWSGRTSSSSCSCLSWWICVCSSCSGICCRCVSCSAMALYVSVSDVSDVGSPVSTPWSNVKIKENAFKSL